LDNAEAPDAGNGAAPLEVLVIGAGQAGLAMGYELKRRGLNFVIVDGRADVGDSWRSRWTSLALFTAAQNDGLPGKPFPAPFDTYPNKEDVADFLRDYAAEFELPVRLGSKVVALSRTDEGYAAETASGRIEAKQVVVATGPFQEPFTPEVASELDPSSTALSTETPRAFPRARSSSSAEQTPAVRSRSSFPRPATSTSPSVTGCPRFRKGPWGATSGGG
jgi:putative flavoprotein involved in K+ transport